MLDLSKMNVTKAAEAGYEFEVTYLGEPLGAFIKVRGEDSPVVKAYSRKKFTEFQMREQAARRRNKEADQMTPEEAEDLSIETAVVRTIGWRGITEGGKEIEFTKENAERIYREHAWIRKLVMENSSEAINFRPVGD